MTAVAGAVLAGGQSRRMGRLKEGVPLGDGRPMLAHVLDALRGACGRVVVVGACLGVPLEPAPDLVHLPDGFPGEGPLAGLVTLLGSGESDAYLLAACDQPLLTPGLLRRLLDGVPHRPRFFRAPDGAPLDPFPGLFPASLLPEALAAFNAGERSVRRFVRGLDAEWVPLSPTEMPLLQDLDTPADLAGLAAG